MSAETKAALGQAARDHFTDEAGEGFMITEWIAIAAGVGKNDHDAERTICWEDSGLAMHHHMGLVRHHMVRAESWPLND